MNTANLKSFVAVAEEESFSRAAALLKISQPAVSLAIKNLEEEFGVKLFERSRGECRLTKFGSLLLGFARQVLEAEANFYRVLEELRGTLCGRLPIASSNIPGEYLLPPLIGEFRKSYPQVEVSVEVSDSHKVIEEIRSGRKEVGFTGLKPRDNAIEAVTLCPDSLLLVASSKHPKAGSSWLRIGELRSEGFILREEGSGTRELMLKALEEAGVDTRSINVVMELGSTSSVLSAVESGTGISMVSSWAAKPLLQEGRLAALRVKGLEAKRYFYMIFRHDRPLSQVASAFLDFIESRVPWLHQRSEELLKS